ICSQQLCEPRAKSTLSASKRRRGFICIFGGREYGSVHHCRKNNIQRTSVDTITIQEEGGMLSSIKTGKQKVQQLLKRTKAEPNASISWDELRIGTICGGSDVLSGVNRESSDWQDV